MNHFQTTGVLMTITLPNDAEAKKGRAGSLVIKYGGRRESKGRSNRQYVNAVPMRVPSKLVKNFREYKAGMFVEVMGRLEGIIEQSVNGGQFHTPQLVANIISEVPMDSFGFALKPTKAHENKPPVGSAESLPPAVEEHEDDEAPVEA